MIGLCDLHTSSACAKKHLEPMVIDFSITGRVYNRSARLQPECRGLVRPPWLHSRVTAALPRDILLRPWIGESSSSSYYDEMWRSHTSYGKHEWKIAWTWSGRWCRVVAGLKLNHEARSGHKGRVFFSVPHRGWKSIRSLKTPENIEIFAHGKSFFSDFS